MLASNSPRRIDFFRDLGLAVEHQSPPVGAEPVPLPGEQPAAYAVRASIAKAASLLPPSARQEASAFLATLSSAPPPAPATLHPFPAPLPLPRALVAADTIVVQHGTILGKPASDAHALDMLRQLQGSSHQVITGCCILAPQAACLLCISTEVAMAPCSDVMLRRYIATGEPADKAGAYAIQGLGAFLVSSIHGSWSNVVGLPLAETLQALQNLGIVEKI